MILKCKMCGGDLNIELGAAICECEFCGTMQTIPAMDNEKKGNLFNRANRLRMASEFDKAAAVYESIVAEFPEEAEAYWGLCLCAYGIEYVDDPATGKKMPTCHRTRQISIMDENNFDMACEYADGVARKLYREEAKEIDRLQRAILEIVAGEEPYDVFICYKETGEDGSRTEDSVLAQDMYDALTEKGLKVFFARITLEDKLGQQYEPYIYAALHSAKVMLAVGTSFEHYDAVWVKNEWSRFLAMGKEDHHKTLIPCFKGIDAYDIPREFRNLQAQDMGKLGWLQDLTRGVMKLCGKDQIAPAPIAPVPAAVMAPMMGGNALGLIKRIFIFLEDKAWDTADEYCEKVLDLDPECGEAYLGKLMAALRVSRRQDLGDLAKPFDENTHYQKILRYGSAALKQEMQGCLDRIRAARMEIIYQSVRQDMAGAADAAQWLKLARRLEEITGYKDADQLAEQCMQRHNELSLEEGYQQALSVMQRAASIRDYADAAWKFEALQDYRDAPHLREECMRLGRELAQRQEEARLLEEKRQREAAEQQEAQRRKEEELKKAQEEKMANGQKKGRIFKDLLVCSPNAKLPLHAAVTSSGQVCVSNWDEYRNTLTSWQRIYAVSLGEFHALGLRTDGAVVASGDNQYGQNNVQGWKNIIAIAAGGWHSVGLGADGTVVATGNYEYGQCDVRGWKDIIAIAAGKNHTVGLKKDGTVVATGLRINGRCDVGSWRDIAAIYAFNGYTVGLKKDGTVECTEEKFRNSAWRNIVDIATGYEYILGLKKDGTVVSAGASDKGQCRVGEWKDVVAVSAKNCHSAALRLDGTVCVTGYNGYGQCDVQSWRDIVAVSVGDFCTLGVRRDGTVLMAGRDNRQPYTQLSKWGHLFDNDDAYCRDREEKCKRMMEDALERLHIQEQEAHARQERRSRGVCQHCGGEFKKTLFAFKCCSCGRARDY